jgi:hypothetical protein
MTKNDVGALSKAAHRVEGFRYPVSDPDMMVGNAKMARNVGIRLRTGFRPMPDDPDGRYPLVHGLRHQRHLVPRLSQMSCQGGELAEPTAVYECYMHLHKPLVSDRSHLQRRASEGTRKARCNIWISCMLPPLLGYALRNMQMEHQMP